MRIALHFGVHSTDEERLLKCLLKNKETLLKEGIAVPAPGRYRMNMRNALGNKFAHLSPDDIQHHILSEMLDGTQPDRVVLSHEHFFCVPGRVIFRGQLLPLAGDRVRQYAEMFPDHNVEVFFATRDMATLLPALYQRMGRAQAVEHFGEYDAMQQRWTAVIDDIRHKNPTVPITIWCNEDTPLIWNAVLREVANHAFDTQLIGTDVLLSKIMTPEGMKRLNAYLQSHPPANDNQRYRILEAFLDKFGIEDAMEEELDMPGWSPQYVEDLTAIYENDIYEISQMPDVSVITP